MIQMPGMLMIGATARNAGKTELACTLLNRFRSRHAIFGVKTTVIRNEYGMCPRGGRGCGACTTLADDFDITEETDSQSGKDTSRMLRAGAKQVFWLRVHEEHVAEGVARLNELIGRDGVSICESNSLRHAVEPGLFLMVRNPRSTACKESARSVWDDVDQFVLFDGKHYDTDVDRIHIVHGQWAIRQAATAVILAGGRSSRMGQDKSLLAIRGRPMVAHIYLQLRPHFDQILISTNTPEKYAFLGLPTVPDPIPDQGPLMGIAAALNASANELNVVIACDIPDINVALIRRMLKEAPGYDAVVPMTDERGIEPLFALYRKSMLRRFCDSLSAGHHRIRDAFPGTTINYLRVENNGWLKNLNTKSEFDAYRRNMPAIAGQSGRGSAR
jgi:molybdopterin-guanine dinucleotide biosynthesis protein A